MSDTLLPLWHYFCLAAVQEIILLRHHFVALANKWHLVNSHVDIINVLVDTTIWSHYFKILSSKPSLCFCRWCWFTFFCSFRNLHNLIYQIEANSRTTLVQSISRPSFIKKHVICVFNIKPRRNWNNLAQWVQGFVNKLTLYQNVLKSVRHTMKTLISIEYSTWTK